MKAWLGTLWNAALLRSEAFSEFRDRRDVFFQGFLIIVAVALLVGAPAFLGDMVRAAQPRMSDAQLEDATNRLDRGLAQIEPFLGFMPAETRGQLAEVTRQIKIWTAAGIQIANLDAVLPRPLGALMQAFGAWLSVPFTRGGFPLSAVSLATWLGYGLWVMLLAKLLGGRGTLAGFLGTSALYAAPHVLTFFAWVPCLGSILNLIALVWGFVIYVKATVVSHELTLGRALVAVFLPMLLIVLAVIAGAALVGALASGLISNMVQQ